MSYPTSITTSKPRAWATIVHNNNIIGVFNISPCYKAGATVVVNHKTYKVISQVPIHNISGKLESVYITI